MALNVGAGRVLQVGLEGGSDPVDGNSSTASCGVTIGVGSPVAVDSVSPVGPASASSNNSSSSSCAGPPCPLNAAAFRCKVSSSYLSASAISP
jgi:hypothetical protein